MNDRFTRDSPHAPASITVERRHSRGPEMYTPVKRNLVGISNSVDDMLVSESLVESQSSTESPPQSRSNPDRLLPIHRMKGPRQRQIIQVREIYHSAPDPLKSDHIRGHSQRGYSLGKLPNRNYPQKLNGPAP